MFRHGKIVNIDDPGSRKIQQNVEDLNKNNEYFLQSIISSRNKVLKKEIKGNTTKSLQDFNRVYRGTI